MIFPPTAVLLAIGFLLGVIAGFVMHRADFCFVAMFRDIFLFKNATKLRALAVYLAVTVVLFETARLCSLLPLYPFPALGPASGVGILGGGFFGIGMVLAGGCVVGTLYRMGAGSLLSFVAFIGLIIGSVVYAEFYTVWRSLLAATVLFSGKATLPQYLGCSPAIPAAVTTLLLGGAVVWWVRNGQLSGRLYARGALQLWQAALVLVGVSLASCLLIGMPLGITTAYAKMGAMVEQVLFPEHLATLPFFTTQPLSFRNPLTGSFLAGGAGPAWDGIAVIQFPLIIGIVFGGALSALLVGEFSVRLALPWRQYASAMAGGILMGLGSRMAPGCNIWHLLGGLPVFAFTSFLFLVGIIPGAWLGSCVLSKWVIR